MSLFFAYPSEPSDLGHTIQGASNACSQDDRLPSVQTWEETEIAGRFISTQVLGGIRDSHCLAADITRLNFNVTYEIGYAIGARIPVILTRNRAINDSQSSTRKELGIFDTLGYSNYENSNELAQILAKAPSAASLDFNAADINTKAPVYLLEPKFKTDQATRMTARVKRARLFFRSFDPIEQPRLSAHDAIDNVAQSAGILLHLVPKHNADWELNNLRAAFLAGLAHGMGKVTTILQSGDDPVPLDFRDFVTPYTHPTQMDEGIEDFAVRTVEQLQSTATETPTPPKSFLAGLSFGASSAENEFTDLGAYYLETAAFMRAERGEARLVVGRKGSGKTAMFARLRDKARRRRTNIVVDLKPEGYKLRKFKEAIGTLLSAGTREHTVMAFWQYLILLEVCYKILEKDAVPHTRDHRLYEPYRRLADTYQTDEYISEGDFSERMSALLERITSDFQAHYGDQSHTVLTEGQVTGLIYRHDTNVLRNELYAYMQHKGTLWILIDNLDKGWPTHGLAEDDLVIVRSLLEATRKLERDFERASLECYTVVFLRNDIHELLLDETPDRGKESKIALDWTDPELLRQMLHRRILFNDVDPKVTFDQIWPTICVSHIYGQESSQFLIDRCLMRPRWLLDLADHCRAHAVNLQHEQIEKNDVDEGFKTFSSDLLIDLGYEVRDVVPDADGLLYEFLGVASDLSSNDFQLILAQAGVDFDSFDAVTEILLWYGFLGVRVASAEPRYIHAVNYDLKRLLAFAKKGGTQHVYYTVNEAFWPALEIKPTTA